MNQNYPQPTQGGQNRRYAMEMMDNVGGQNSEMSAVSLYFYNHLVTEGELSDFFHRVSIAEMRHLEIFGELARRMGADPRLWSCQGGQTRYWSPNYNPYTVNPAQLLENAAEHERQAIAKYERQAQCIGDPYIVQTLRKIIAEEQEHLQTLLWFCGR